MSDSKEEVHTKEVPIEGTSKGITKRARDKRLKPEQVPYMMKCKYQGSPVPSKFDYEVMNITDTLVGHMDLEQFHKDTFLEDVVPRARRIA